MSKKLYGLLLPVLATLAFASMSGAAQAAPQWHLCKFVGANAGTYEDPLCQVNVGAGNGAFEKFVVGGAAAKVRVATTGKLTLTVGTTTVTCFVLDRGKIWNEGGVGHDEILAFENYDCVSNFCTTGLSLTASGFPWPSKLVAGPPVRDELEKVKVNLKCTTPATNLTFEGTLKPKWVNGSPSFAEFDTGSGKLKDAEGTEASVSGKDNAVEAETGANVEAE